MADSPAIRQKNKMYVLALEHRNSRLVTINIFEYSTGCNDWIQTDGYAVSEGHGTTNECYATLEEAKSICLAASDCHAIASQNDTCGGEFRVSHGGPTLNYISTWKSLNIRAWVRTCGAGNKTISTFQFQ